MHGDKTKLINFEVGKGVTGGTAVQGPGPGKGVGHTVPASLGYSSGSVTERSESEKGNSINDDDYDSDSEPLHFARMRLHAKLGAAEEGYIESGAEF
jgi:hypothetical protein